MFENLIAFLSFSPQFPKSRDWIPNFKEKNPVIGWSRIVILGGILMAFSLRLGSASGVNDSVEQFYRLETGDYVIEYQRGAKSVCIRRSDTLKDNPTLALTPGGGDSTFKLLDPSNVQRVFCDTNETGKSIIITGKLEWCTYKATICTHRSFPGLLNSRIEIVTTRDVDPDEELFKRTYPELSYLNADRQVQTGAAVAPVYYFNGTPGAKTYHTVAPNSGAVYDLNQWVFFGDPTVLQSTLQYYVDFTSLNEFFKKSGTRIRGTVSQPPGCLEYPLKAGLDGLMVFGYDIPTLESRIERGTSLSITNSFLYLASDVPGIQESVKYCGRFIEGYGAIYPNIKKPSTRFIDWPAITEQGFKDVLACQEKLGRSVMGPQTNLWSCRRYLEQFDSSTGWALVEKDEELWSQFHLSLPYGDAWQYLFPLIMAGEYAEDFGSEAARNVFLNAANDVVKVGRSLNYIFPLRINKDLSPAEGWLNEYDCVGAYIYLMLMYHKHTGASQYLDEARTAADVLQTIGFEYPYEFTTTSLAPVALLRLYKITEDTRYLEACSIPVAAILRHSWLFNPDYGDYRGRTIFLLTEAMPGVYANGWEEATQIRYLQIFLKEGQGIIPKRVLDLVSELLRWKGISIADSLVPLLPDDSIVYNGIPREWPMRVEKSWYIPVEGFGYLEWDDSGLHDRLGRVSQGPYCFGAFPEAAMLLFHPLKDNCLLYVETPIRLRKTGSNAFVFNVLGGQEIYRAAMRMNSGRAVVLMDGNKKIAFDETDAAGWSWMQVQPSEEYSIELIDSDDRAKCIDH